MNKSFGAFALCLWSFVFIPQAQSVAAAAKMPASAQPARPGATPDMIPPNYLPTPFGFYVAAQCYIRLRDDEYIRNNQIYSTKTGTTKIIDRCTQPRFNRNGSEYADDNDYINDKSGNHDLILYATAPTNLAINSASQSLYKPDVLPEPKKLANQTIFFSAGVTGDDLGAYATMGWNMPNHPKWAFGSFLANVKGNVIARTFELITNQGVKGYDLSAGTSGRPESSTSHALMYNSEVSFWGHRGDSLGYVIAKNLATGTAMSVQTFGVTSCDMMPNTASMTGTLGIVPIDGNGTRYNDLQNMTLVNRELCQMKLNVTPYGQGETFFSFELTFDTDTTTPPSTGRSATITYTTAGKPN